MRCVRRWSTLLAVAIVLSGCTPRDTAVERDPDITGVITAVQRSESDDRLGVIRVETVPEDEAGTPKASVTIDRDTEIAGIEASGTSQAFERLGVGERVHVWFTGPVMESYPVQATAARVELAGSAPER